MPESEIMTIREVAAYLRLAEKSVYRYAAEGKIPGVKIGGAWRFRRDEIEEYTKTKRNEKVSSNGN
tara:strand:+ start:723 stop:920 length:198 start_codon:yes stop_codon:yes gene_type:complete